MESQRLAFYPPSMDHQPLILEAIIESKEALSEFLSWVPFSLTEAESVKNTEKAIENFEAFQNEIRYTLIEKTTNQFVGLIGLIIHNQDIPYFEIGYWLRSRCVGYGFMTEAVQTLERYAFNELKAKRLEIRTADTNHKSYAIAERCNYRFEGKLMNHRVLPNGNIGHTLVYAKTKL